jgi:hypothetical protein
MIDMQKRMACCELRMSLLELALVDASPFC